MASLVASCSRWRRTSSRKGRTLTGRVLSRCALIGRSLIAIAGFAVLLAACSPPPKVANLTPVGFPITAVRVRQSDGTERTVCMFLAESEADRARGLMGVTSIGDKSGMVFRFGTETTARFFMFHTKIPLDIAFVGADGQVVSIAPMEPCPAENASDCPLTAASASYVDAIEAPSGSLGRLGIVPGSTVLVTNTPC